MTRSTGNCPSLAARWYGGSAPAGSQYGYAYSNPLSYIDPTGEVPLVAVAWAYARCVASCTAIDAAFMAAGMACTTLGDAAKDCGVSCLNPSNWFKFNKFKVKNNVVPPIKPGSAGGPSAGGRFPQSVKDGAYAENPKKICVYCRQEGVGTQVDHSIPRARGGNATAGNAQLACPHCNASKGAGDFPKSPAPGYKGPWPPSHW